MSVQQPTATYYGTDSCPDEGGYSWCGINVPSRRSPKGLGAMSDSGAATFDGEPSGYDADGLRVRATESRQAKIDDANRVLREMLEEGDGEGRSYEEIKHANVVEMGKMIEIEGTPRNAAAKILAARDALDEALGVIETEMAEGEGLMTSGWAKSFDKAMELAFAYRDARREAGR